MTLSVNEIMTAISTVGFPIVACGAMFYEMHVQNEKHKEEMDSLKDVISELKVAIVELRDYVKGSNNG